MKLKKFNLYLKYPNEKIYDIYTVVTIIRDKVNLYRSILNKATNIVLVITLDILLIVIGKNLFSICKFICIITGSINNSNRPHNIYIINCIKF